jgi:S-DNA-T family DNA segregation ATPase FtsK/SpoIIIE
VPDEGTILNAIKHLGIRGFNKAIKEGWQIRFITPPTISGKGWWAQLALPPACPVYEIVKRKPMLAHNLVRFPREVWPTEPRDQPGVLDLFVANQGALSGRSSRGRCWPTWTPRGSTTSPGSRSRSRLRGDIVRGRLYEANYFFGGAMGSGKSTMAITLVLRRDAGPARPTSTSW